MITRPFAAAIVTVIAALAARFGFDLSGDVESALVDIVMTLASIAAGYFAPRPSAARPESDADDVSAGDGDSGDDLAGDAPPVAEVDAA